MFPPSKSASETVWSRDQIKGRASPPEQEEPYDAISSQGTGW
jgi:hypothetical protein